ncbi:KH domain-containing protein [Cardamine amara subsp. amara]|uniref:KH domain-containing protein n=1 Tax=Cardamine amara subsp. amara TaxID=228776 RepID=A0ABD0ZGF6_CARAN
MVERGKRNHDRSRDNNNNNRNQKRRISYETDEKKINNKEDLIVAYRILCPSGVIGSVIGKSGKVINLIRQETKARIKVVDPFPGSTERVITIFCSVKEKKDIVDIETSESSYAEKIVPLCSAQDALIRVHDAIVTSLATAAENTKIDRDDIRECRILVPSSQCSNVIGKAGSIIKKIRSRTRANVKVVSKDVSDPSHTCAMDFDNIVLISGEAEAVKKALFTVSAIMYKFSPREQIPLDTTIQQEVPASIIIPSDLSIYPQAGLYQNQDPVFQHGANVPSFIGTLPQGYGESAANPMPVFSSSALPVVHGFGGSSRSEKLVIKVLCSSSNIGRVIGKGGSTIKGIRQATGSHIEVDDSRKNRDDNCVITVSATESPDDLKSMAVESVLLLQEKITDVDEKNVKMQLLVPSKVIGCIIGKSGSIISEIRKRTNADIHISKGNNKPKFADPNDELVEISGETSNVRDALIQIVLRLRDDVLRDREIGSRNQPPARSENKNFFSSGSSNTGLALPPSFMSSIPQVASVDFDRRPETGNSMGMLSSNVGLYGYGSFPVTNNGYGSNSSYGSNLYAGLPQSTTMEVRIPANAVSKVIGKGGGNLDNIRRISGAMIEISDSKTSHGGRIALISGTPDQKRTAENLFQAFIMST